MEQKEIRIGIAGTGKIVPESAEALLETGFKLVSIWGPHVEKAVPLAAKYSIPNVCSTYEELLSSGIDCVYIALVNSVHFEYAMKALEAGINVLLEKPFCSTLSEAQKLVSFAIEKGLYLFETISNVYLPSWAMVQKRIADIGPVKLFQADFSQYSSRYEAYLRGEVSPSFNPLFEGGALRDLNVYNIHLAVSLLGRPQEVIYRPNRGYNGVDTSGILLLQYSDLQAVCTAAKDSGNPSGVTIQGEKGWIRLTGMPNILPQVEVCVRGKEPESFSPNRYTSRLCHMFASIRDIMERGDLAAMQQRLSNTLVVTDILQRAV